MTISNNKQKGIIEKAEELIQDCEEQIKDLEGIIENKENETSLTKSIHTAK